MQSFVFKPCRNESLANGLFKRFLRYPDIYNLYNLSHFGICNSK